MKNQTNDFIESKEFQELLEYQKENLMSLNILEITGMGTQEIKHSRLLAWMFGANEHGLGHKILDVFLQKVGKHNKHNELENINLSKNNFLVYPEDNNIDLLIVDEANKIVIAIENKIYAGEGIYSNGTSQLQKYYLHVDVKYKEYTKHFIFLTKDGVSPFNECDQDKWLTATHQMIGEVVLDILNESEICDERVKFIFESYVDLLKRRNIMEDAKLKELCENIWSKEENKKALDILVSYRKTDLDRFVESFLGSCAYETCDEGIYKYIITNAHYKMALKFYKQKDWNESPATIEIQLNKFKNYIWFGYFKPNAEELMKHKDYRIIHEKLFAKRNTITKEHTIKRISEDDFYNKDYDEISKVFMQDILNEIKRFEDIVSEVLKTSN